MAAPFSRFDSKTSNFASTSHLQPLLLPAPSSSTPRILDLNELPVPEEDLPEPIQIEDPMALEDNCGSSADTFQEFKTFNDFQIVFNKVPLDGDLSDEMRSGYYRLCSQEKDFLHTGISKDLDSVMAVGMIGETVNVSREIENFSLTTTTSEELDMWDKILKALELLGMKVKFLREKIKIRRTFMSNSEAAEDIQKYRKAANDLKLNEDEILRAESDLRKLRESATKCEASLRPLKQKAEEFENKLQELVNAPW